MGSGAGGSAKLEYNPRRAGDARIARSPLRPIPHRVDQPELGQKVVPGKEALAGERESALPPEVEVEVDPALARYASSPLT
jgi:hypothetical protein